MNKKIAGASASAAGLTVALLFSSITFAADKQSSSINILVITTGFAIGWLLGTLISPYSDTEEQKFTIYAKAMGSFLSGYVLAKIDNLTVYFFKPDFILDTIVGFRVMAFIAALAIGTVLTFVFRRYT